MFLIIYARVSVERLEQRLPSTKNGRWVNKRTYMIQGLCGGWGGIFSGSTMVEAAT